VDEMATFKRFEDIEAWQQARVLVNEICFLTNNGKFSRDFSLCDQIKRAGYSIMNNIAEGHERDGNREFKQFLSVSKGSTGEVKSMLYVSKDQGYIDEITFKRLYDLSSRIGAMVFGLIKYLKKTSRKGIKFVKTA
jgi:four helix bundle protein